MLIPSLRLVMPQTPARTAALRDVHAGGKSDIAVCASVLFFRRAAIESDARYHTCSHAARPARLRRRRLAPARAATFRQNVTLSRAHSIRVAPARCPRPPENRKHPRLCYVARCAAVHVRHAHPSAYRYVAVFDRRYAGGVRLKFAFAYAPRGCRPRSPLCRRRVQCACGGECRL